MLDRAQLRYFLAVVDHGTFSRAAEQCRVSQPTMSAGIARLEAEVGQPLFDRSSRRVALTPAGARLVAHARRIETEFLEAQQAINGVARGRLIRLGVAATLPAALIGTALAAAAGSDAEAIELIEGRASELVTQLDRGRIDAVLGPLVEGHRRVIELFEEPYLLAMAATHRLAGRDAIGAEMLIDETMLVRRQCEALPLVSQFFTARGVRPFMAARSLSEERTVAYVRAGLGVTVMPACLAADGIVMRPLAGFGLTRRVGFTIEPGEHGRLRSSATFARMVDALRG
jgi:DNA-binding transcriptional LysR family regulator